MSRELDDVYRAIDSAYDAGRQEGIGADAAGEITALRADLDRWRGIADGLARALKVVSPDSQYPPFFGADEEVNAVIAAYEAAKLSPPFSP